MNEPVFIPRILVEILHSRSLAEHGGQDGIRDNGTLESALSAPLNTYYYAHGDLCDVAAAYAFHIAQNQPFIDGNKRTAITTALLFLEANGVVTTSIPSADLYQAMIAIAEKRMDKQGLAAVFRRHLSP